MGRLWIPVYVALTVQSILEPRREMVTAKDIYIMICASVAMCDISDAPPTTALHRELGDQNRTFTTDTALCRTELLRVKTRAVNQVGEWAYRWECQCPTATLVSTIQ